MVKNKYFIYPEDVSAFGFDWGKLSLTVAPRSTVPAAFPAASSSCQAARAIPATITRARRKSFL